MAGATTTYSLAVLDRALAAVAGAAPASPDAADHEGGPRADDGHSADIHCLASASAALAFFAKLPNAGQVAFWTLNSDCLLRRLDPAAAAAPGAAPRRAALKKLLAGMTRGGTKCSATANSFALVARPLALFPRDTGAACATASLAVLQARGLLLVQDDGDGGGDDNCCRRTCWRTQLDFLAHASGVDALLRDGESRSPFAAGDADVRPGADLRAIMSWCAAVFLAAVQQAGGAGASLQPATRARLLAAARFAIKGCANASDGGAGRLPGAESHAGFTFCAAGVVAAAGRVLGWKSLLGLSAIREVDRFARGVLLFVRARGGRRGRAHKEADSCYCFWNVAAASLALEILEGVDAVGYSNSAVSTDRPAELAPSAPRLRELSRRVREEVLSEEVTQEAVEFLATCGRGARPGESVAGAGAPRRSAGRDMWLGGSRNATNEADAYHTNYALLASVLLEQGDDEGTAVPDDAVVDPLVAMQASVVGAMALL